MTRTRDPGDGRKHPELDTWSALIDGEAAPREAKNAAAHLQSCSSCRQSYRELESVSLALRGGDPRISHASPHARERAITVAVSAHRHHVAAVERGHRQRLGFVGAAAVLLAVALVVGGSVLFGSRTSHRPTTVFGSSAGPVYYCPSSPVGLALGRASRSGCPPTALVELSRKGVARVSEQRHGDTAEVVLVLRGGELRKLLSVARRADTSSPGYVLILEGRTLPKVVVHGDRIDVLDIGLRTARRLEAAARH